MVIFPLKMMIYPLKMVIFHRWELYWNRGEVCSHYDTLFSREPRLVIRPDDVPFLPMYPKSRFHQTKGSAAYVYASAASVHGKIATMETGQHIGLIRDRFHTVSPPVIMFQACQPWVRRHLLVITFGHFKLGTVIWATREQTRPVHGCECKVLRQFTRGFFMGWK
jgi:hypothetical protein